MLSQPLADCMMMCAVRKKVQLMFMFKLTQLQENNSIVFQVFNKFLLSFQMSS